MDATDISGARCYPLWPTDHCGWNRPIPVFHTIRHLQPLVQLRNCTFHDNQFAYDDFNQFAYRHSHRDSPSDYIFDGSLPDSVQPSSNLHSQCDHSICDSFRRRHLNPQYECNTPCRFDSSSPDHCEHGSSSAQLHSLEGNQDYDSTKDSPVGERE